MICGLQILFICFGYHIAPATPPKSLSLEKWLVI